MISSAIYTVNQKVSTSTDLIESAPVTDPAIVPYSDDLAAPYYMGYVLQDDAPTSMMANVVKLNDSTLTIKQLPQNHSWGFCTYRYSAGNQASPQFMCYVDSNNARQLYFRASDPNYQVIRFINYAEMAKMTAQNYFGVGYRYGWVKTENLSDSESAGGFTANQVYGFYSGSAYFTWQQWEQFLTDQYTIPICNHQAVGPTTNRKYFTVNVKYSDFDEYGTARYYDENDDQTYTMYVQFYSARTYGVCRYGVPGAGSSELVGLVPFFSYDIPDTTNLPAQRMFGYENKDENAEIVLSFNYAQREFTGLKKPTDWQGTWIDDIKFGSFKIPSIFRCQDIPLPISTSLNSNYGGIIRGKTIFKRDQHTSTSDSLIIYSNIHPDDVTKVIAFYHKIDLLSSGYSNITASDTYTTDHSTELFDSNSVPLYERREEDISTLAPLLVDWQLPGTPITDDEFTYEDMPEYGPEDGGRDENTGDNVYRPSGISIGGTNGFVTQYALRASQVQELGAILWTSIFDQDYWKNYMFSLALDTGSFSLASILSFFVSLRAYPFSMLNVASYATFGTKMYIGTGIKSLDFNTQLHTINQYCDYVSGGWRIVWSDDFYGDWRDYINTEIVLYIPYCGTLQLNPGDVVGNLLTLQYAVDFATGGCIAYVDVDTQDGHHFSIGSLAGQIGADVPLTATAAGEVAARFIGDAMHIGGLIASDASQAVGAAIGAASGDVKNLKPSITGAAAGFGGAPAAAGVEGVKIAADMAPKILSRGAVSAPMMTGGRGFASLGAPQTPYIQIRRAIYPDDQELEKVAGKPAAAAKKISALSGFVAGDAIVSIAGATAEEQAEIQRAIAAGIIV